MNARMQRLAGASMLVAMLAAGCGGADRVDAAHPGNGGEAHAAASQDHLPQMASSVPVSATADDTAREVSHDACRHWIAMSCVQASLRSEAICRLARCEQVAGFWVLNIPHEQVEEDLRRRGY